MENNELESKQSEFDEFWMKKRNGYQITELKYPNFDDITIDYQLRYDLTLDNFFEDIHSSSELLFHLENTLINLLLNENCDQLKIIFQKNNFKSKNLLLFSYMSRRKITLIYYLVKQRFYPTIDKSIKKIIETEFNQVTQEKILNDFFTTFNRIHIKKDDKDLDDFSEIIKVQISHEKSLIEINHIPSISAICICLKFLISIINNGLKDCEIILKKFNQDFVIDLLLSVFFSIYLVTQNSNSLFTSSLFLSNATRRSFQSSRKR